MLLPEAAPWLDDFELEVLAFPYGRYDDQVDSLSQFLTWAQRARRRAVGRVAFPIFVDRAEAIEPQVIPAGWGA